MAKEYTLAEAASITGEKYEKLKVDSRRGILPTEVRFNGSKPYKVITAETLANLLNKKTDSGYAALKAEWRGEMFAGTHSGTSTPVSANYMTQLERGLKKIWAANGCEESIAALNADALRKTFAHYQFDEEARRDHYSTKMHIYKAISSFTQFLIRKGYKPASALLEIKELRPKPRIKPKRHSLELIEVWDAIHFNSHWNDGRTAKDQQIMDMLLFLYGFTGVRRMEAANIKISGVNFGTNEILVPGKWGKDRLVPMPADLSKKIKEWIEHLRPESKLPYLVVNERGNKLTEQIIALRFSRFSKALALNKALIIVKQRNSDSGTFENQAQFFDVNAEICFPNRNKEKLLKEAEEVAKTLNCAVRPHDLRRGYAKMLSDQGMPLPRIQYVLGHSEIETTMKYINIKQKEASQWVHENFVITLPKKQNSVIQIEADEQELKEFQEDNTSKTSKKKKYRY